MNNNPTKDNGLTARNSQPAKALTKHATDFIALCAPLASLDAAVICAAALVAAETIRLLVLGVLQ